MRFAANTMRDAASALRRGLAVFALATAALTGAAAAQTLASLPNGDVGARVRGDAKPIAAWSTFCQDYAAECAIDRTEPARITLTPATWNTIVAVSPTASLLTWSTCS